MINVIKIIKEEIQSFSEGSYDAQGVADKAYEKFHIYPDDANVKTLDYMQKQQEEPYGYADWNKIPVYLNPRNLSNFDADVRAISDKEGNLYVLQKNAGMMHGTLGHDIGLVENSLYMYRDDADFLLLHRVGLTNTFGFSDTTIRVYNINKIASSHVLELLNIVRRKHPQYEFTPEYYQYLKQNN